MSATETSGMTYEAETDDLKPEFNGDFDTTEDEKEASHFPTDTCTHTSCTCTTIC